MKGLPRVLWGQGNCLSCALTICEQYLCGVSLYFLTYNSLFHFIYTLWGCLLLLELIFNCSEVLKLCQWDRAYLIHDRPPSCCQLSLSSCHHGWWLSGMCWHNGCHLGLIRLTPQQTFHPFWVEWLMKHGGTLALIVVSCIHLAFKREVLLCHITPTISHPNSHRYKTRGLPLDCRPFFPTENRNSPSLIKTSTAPHRCMAVHFPISQRVTSEASQSNKGKYLNMAAWIALLPIMAAVVLPSNFSSWCSQNSCTAFISLEMASTCSNSSCNWLPLGSRRRLMQASVRNERRRRQCYYDQKAFHGHEYIWAAMKSSGQNEVTRVISEAIDNIIEVWWKGFAWFSPLTTSTPLHGCSLLKMNAMSFRLILRHCWPLYRSYVLHYADWSTKSCSGDLRFTHRL